VLFLLSPAIGEVLSGSTPLFKLLTPGGPIVLAYLALLYGGGALLIRELTHRWQKGWPTVLILGAAYGIVEEGLFVKSFFDPHWHDLGPMANYGRWAGVNFVWAVMLTIYHAFVSIALPILLANLMFPSKRAEAWISRRAFRILASVWTIDVVFAAFFFNRYSAPLLPYLATVLLVVALYQLARQAPASFAVSRRPSPRLALWFWLAGFAGTLLLFILGWGLPTSTVPPLITVVLLGALLSGFGWVVLSLAGASPLPDRHCLWLAAGGLSFFVFFAFLQELRHKAPWQSLMALAAIVFIVWLARRPASSLQRATS
jgi:uncharacterized membrane protein YdcZ (DUF606 family)